MSREEAFRDDFGVDFAVGLAEAEVKSATRAIYNSPATRLEAVAGIRKIRLNETCAIHWPYVRRTARETIQF